MKKLTFNKERCKGCGLCVMACPKKILALSEETNKNGYNFAYCINEDACISCASCAIMCPDVVIEVEK